MKKLFASVFVCVCWFSLAANGRADSFTDSLTAGYSSNTWVLRTNTGAFSVITNQGNVTFTKAANTSAGLQYATLAWLYAAQGDFDAQVDFTNASITEVSSSVGNQVQLNTRFGGQDFLMVRSSENSLGQNAHVYPSPPGTVGMGVIPWTASSGTLRVTRVGTLVQGYIDSTAVYSGNYNTNDATFSFVLQNNQTSDAVTCGFNNFRITAAHLAPLQPKMSISSPSPGKALIGWKDTSWPDFLRGYRLQTSTNLTQTSFWVTSTLSQGLTNNFFGVSDNTSTAATFYRLLQGP